MFIVDCYTVVSFNAKLGKANASASVLQAGMEEQVL